MKVNLNLYNFGSTDDNHSKQKNVPVTEKQNNEKILFSSSEKSKFVKPNDAIFTKYIKYQ
jgi:hypothetical protein